MLIMKELRLKAWVLTAIGVAVFAGCASQTVSTHRLESRPRGAEAWDASCLATKQPKCPEPEVVIEACDEAPTDALSVADALAQSSGDESSVKVVGVLVASDETVCTLRACLGKMCCNTCAQSLELRDESAREVEGIRLSDPRLSCGGDESVRCCKVKPGTKIRATGVLRDASLENATICRVP